MSDTRAEIHFRIGDNPHASAITPHIPMVGDFVVFQELWYVVKRRLFDYSRETDFDVVVYITIELNDE